MAHPERANINDTFYSSWQIYDQVSIPPSVFPEIFMQRLVLSQFIPLIFQWELV